MFVGKNIKLREVREEDIKLFWKWKNDAQYYKYFYDLIPITWQEQQEWILKILSDPSELIFTIALNQKDSVAIGTVGFQHIDRRNRKAEWGRWIIGSREQAPRGAGKEVEFLMLEYAFEHLGLNKLYCEVLTSNKMVVNLHKRFGFVEEGLFKEHIFKQGKFVDVIFLSLYSNNYYKNKDNIKNIAGLAE
jgi:UDP-4-amino-4,6-dideoxy-N-acetyl-beta-L-altrosamine N-acetyltransferase